ncbi:NAD(P)H-binding protein [Vibrio sp. D404a]|uniref:NmrA family NAD(P)-binding protein n=1 Tax=unclassified Vibrio TaxID=2614977 RepID=UPI0025521C73|nr:MULTISPECIES: NmrA family NAD(P)-binding protein [unclassified Vibrio]MDK9735971.1 NAD(P)H-binding protein [Vibrio sp. D404a]MDK9797863.1 NAD(P)H-binding protein [Vibrio sp. D449a]
MSDATPTRPIVIIGKNAKTGVRVNKLLSQLGIETRQVSRSAATYFDWEARSSWPTALKGARSAYVTYQPDLAVPNAEGDINAFVEVAKAQGVEHIVLLSGRGEEGAEKAERILINSGLDWNIVRASWFAQNFSESFMAQGVLEGELVLPAGNTPEPFIDTDDIAEVAVAALVDPSKRNSLYEVTGPELMTFQDCVDEISKQLGRKIKFTPVSIEAYLEILKSQNLPEDYQWLLNELFTVVFDGRNSNVTHGVEEAIGRKPTKFSDYVSKTMAAGYWD